ncbi:hypothetical protein N9R87_01770 [Flavobacteriaceae bacterium]|nr:hypothetical protein [Flavobacteriaceae bacterium]
MKKYFLFDNEPITGLNYFTRLIIGTMLIGLFGLGLWIISATAYKRSGAFNWPRQLKIITSILIPFVGIIIPLMNDSSMRDSVVFNTIGLPLIFLHLILLLKNGNDSFQ